MTMEFFGWKKSDEFFGKDAQKFRYNHLFGAVTFIPYGTMVDHFQHIIYENPSMTPTQRHEVWKELSAVYMPWMKLDGSLFYGEGKGCKDRCTFTKIRFTILTTALHRLPHSNSGQ